MKDLDITIIQTDLFWEDKQANLGMLEKKIQSLINKPQLVVLPEMFSTGFTMNSETMAETMDGDTVDWMRNISKDKKMILTGSCIIKENDLFFNRLIWMMPNGNYGFYDKRHLFGYAKENQHYTAGNKRLICSVNGWKVQLQICYDLRFPVWARQQIREDAPEFDVLIYVANWPAKRSHAWKTLLCARAIENQCYVVGVNRVGNDAFGNNHSGDSMIIDPLGEIIYHKAEEEDIFSCTLSAEKLKEIRSNLPFLKDADGFIIL